MRGSKGASEPRAASSDRAPVTRAERNRVSASKRPTSAFAVENCVPLRRARPSFAARTMGASPGFGERLRRRRHEVADARLPDADHRGRHMGERGEISGGAGRALRRNHRRHPAREHRFDEIERFEPHARGALGEARELKRHHEPRRCDGERLADAGRMRQHDVALERRKIGGFDPHARELAEPRVDPIDGLAAGEDAPDCRGARRDSRATGRIERGGAAEPDAAPVAERRFARPERHSHWPLQTRACKGLNPSR